MRNKFWEKRIPTLLGIIMIFFAVIGTSYVVKTGTNFVGNASPPETPESVRITNISENSFTVSYTTSAVVLGSLSYGKDKNLGSTIIDDRDQQTGNLNSYKIHNITVRNLTPLTGYFFSITSGSNTFLNGLEPFEVATGPQINTSPSEQEPIVGKLVLEDGSAPKEAILYVTIPNAQTLSTIAKPDGTYLLPLNSMLSQNLSSYFSFSENPIIEMLAINDTGEKSTVMLRKKQTNPIPVITFSKNYDFSIDTSPVATVSGSIGFPSFSASESAKVNIQISTPKKNEGFTDLQPTFKGKAKPGEDVKISIHSLENIESSIKTDSKGNWSFRPQAPLSPGEHTISISSRDQSGILKTIIQSFTVYAQGTQVGESATPSATPIITIAPTPTLGTTPTLTISPTPTTQFTPTPTLIPTLTLTPTLIPITIITPTPVKISSPGSSSLISAGITVLITTIIGACLFLINRGGSMSL